jgi:16S rRNA (guanine966-N2)-methyltransferase
MMRIGGGVVNGRRLRTVPGQRVRPTSGRVRQALFSMLQERIADAVFIDLFAGTGSVGLEALSHGAQHVYFIERDRRTLQVLQRNICHCELARQTTVVIGSLPQVVKRLPGDVQADILFLDPPYASDLAEKTFDALSRHVLLAPHGMVIWQHAVQHLAPTRVMGLSLWQRRRYGDTQLSFYMP